jgi:hypothetical protein
MNLRASVEIREALLFCVFLAIIRPMASYEISLKPIPIVGRNDSRMN